MNQIKEQLTKMTDDLINKKEVKDFKDFYNVLNQLGNEKSKIEYVSEANVLATSIISILAGNFLVSMGMQKELITAAIQIFLDMYPDDLYFIIGVLYFAGKENISFEPMKPENKDE